MPPYLNYLNRDNHRLFYPLNGPAPAFLSPNGQGADAAADPMVILAQERVAAEGTTAAVSVPNLILGSLVTGNRFQRGH